MITLRFITGVREDKDFRDVGFPEKENEFTPAHLQTLATFVWIASESKYQLNEYLHCLRKMLQASGVPIKFLKKVSNGQLYDELLPLIKGFISENNTTQWIIKKLRVGPWRYYGPSNRLGNVTLDEFVFAHSYFTAYAKHRQLDMLNMLVATLYRPRKWYWMLVAWWPYLNTGDCRQQFRRHTIDARAARLARISMRTKLAVLHNYQGCVNALVKKYEPVFSAPAEGERPYNVAQMIIDCAGIKFGTVTETGRTNLHLILMELDKVARQANNN